jgi:hypothetical protein
MHKLSSAPPVILIAHNHFEESTMGFTRLLRLGAIAAVLAAGAAPAAAHVDVNIVTMPPPPPRVEYVQAAPPGYTWAPGYWAFNGRRYVWVTGQWIAVQPDYQWVPAAWVPQGPQWHFQRGHWRPAVSNGGHRRGKHQWKQSKHDRKFDRHAGGDNRNHGHRGRGRHGRD